MRQNASSIVPSHGECSWHVLFMECLVSLSWILHGAFNQINYEEYYLMLQILVKNISEENLLEEYFCRESILINVELLLGSNKSSTCYFWIKEELAEVFKEDANPNSVVVHAVLCIESRTRFCVCLWLWAFLVSSWCKLRTSLLGVVMCVILS